MIIIRRIFVEKKKGYNVEAQKLLKDFKETLFVNTLTEVRVLHRYDIEGLNEKDFNSSIGIIFSEPTIDDVFMEDFNVEDSEVMFAVEYLPGQYDQRRDSALQCIQIIAGNNEVNIKCAKVIILQGALCKEEIIKIKNYCINSVDSREAELKKPETLMENYSLPKDIHEVSGFINMDESVLSQYLQDKGLAMNLEDIGFVQNYFREKERRNPTTTEIKVIDTFWSDHCRHTTFLTVLEDIRFEHGKFNIPAQKAFQQYLDMRREVYIDKSKDINLMDMATICMKEMRKNGLLDDLEVSEENNACSMEIDVDHDGNIEKWLLMFKNETHNHPTEIEPFGGAATCIGGAIRDPLSGRSYVYQCMRVTGSGDVRVPVKDTIPGKLPQRKISVEAASGYSSYGNQIGLATGSVTEIYHEGYIAKRLEIGAVIGATLKKNVRRESPEPSDVIVLVGGRTGRDGCGGATGSSKEHDESSLANCGAEVQKGNALTERKIQRLMKNPKATLMIKKCNDFGAGGVAVAIGELSDGLDIDLDKVLKKYEGLDGTELAISESQERMAVVIQKENLQEFIQLCHRENLEAVKVAEVVPDRRLRMKWRDKYIVDISRDFLDTNGAKRYSKVLIKSPDEGENYFTKNNYLNKSFKDSIKEMLSDINVCSQKGLVERFDSTVGAASVLMPFGGKFQLTPEDIMVGKIPVGDGKTSTVSIMSNGINPYLTKWSPFHGAVFSVVEAVTKIAAAGGDYSRVRMSFQEYFERLRNDPERFGKPTAALLGACFVQNALSIPAIGGKDSMSGSFMEQDVPPTIATFAVGVGEDVKIISSEFKKSGNKVVLIKCPYDEYYLPQFQILKKNMKKIFELSQKNKIIASRSVKFSGISETIMKMCFGNMIGFKFDEGIDLKELFKPMYGSIIIEIDSDENIDNLLEGFNYCILGTTTKEPLVIFKNEWIDLQEAVDYWTKPLEGVFPTKTKENKEIIPCCITNNSFKGSPLIKVPSPKVCIPVFPGTNCEYDTRRAFESCGALVDEKVFINLSPKDIEESIDSLVASITKANILMIPGGFSAGDEPDGSGKFIATVFRNSKLKDAVMDLIKHRDGLILGICNGFQALIKLGLVPFGEIIELNDSCPTLSHNVIGRHVSTSVSTKVVSKLSPWLSLAELNGIYNVPVSHGEGRFVCSKEMGDYLMKNGQIVTQYVDFEGNPSYDIRFNPNGSFYAIEGICSKDGRVFGKMGHSERTGKNLLINVGENTDIGIFKSGVNYFK